MSTPGKESLRDLMARKRREVVAPTDTELVSDPYDIVNSTKNTIRKETGYAYDERVLLHECEWDKTYPENPYRLQSIIDRCQDPKYDLLKRCKPVNADRREDLYETAIKVHTKEHYATLKTITESSPDELKNSASKFDSVYFNSHTFEAACQSLNCVLNLVEEVMLGSVMNGMALVRPPGHHAMQSEYCGYCYFNNVAIAADMCIAKKYAQRILIVDFDVHHGQATQQTFYERNDVLYFSIHRYEQGRFWPNLAESNFNFIGKGPGMGYNINVPLNKTGMSDADYLAIILYILLPVAYEFNPDIVIVSAGYDAAIGCPEGEMELTPGFYAHLITMLSGVANGKIAVCLEGGYFPPSLSEGVCLTIKALLGDPCPKLKPIVGIDPTVITSINNARLLLKRYWKCFELCDVSPESTRKVEIGYFGVPLEAPFLTENCYPVRAKIDLDYHEMLIKALQPRYESLKLQPIYYVYNETMLLHRPPPGMEERPEKPERLVTIKKHLDEFGLSDRMVQTSIVDHDFSQYSVHDLKYSESINSLAHSKDIYTCEHTSECAKIAVNGILTLVDAVAKGSSSGGLGVVRPPGHHAEHNLAMGYCFQNNVAIAAKYILQKGYAKKVLIVDFDAHHGNGTQSAFYENPDVMYISIHRFDDGKFYPGYASANFTYDGQGPGRGYNLNIPLNHEKMGDSDYIASFHSVILPAAYSFSPDFVLLSAGFDAGINDPLVGYRVSPETFGHFVQLLKPLAGGKLVVTLEGGYNLTTTSLGVVICAKALLGDPLPPITGIYSDVHLSTIETLRSVMSHFKQFWPIFNINEELAEEAVLVKSFKTFVSTDLTNKTEKNIQWEQVFDSTFVEEELQKLSN